MPNVYNSSDYTVKEDDNGRNEKRLKEEKLNRIIQDENDVLKEEFDRQLNEIKNLWSSEPKDGKLILNKVNIEKSALYLNTKNYMNHIKSRHDPSEEELREMKRNKRKAEGYKKHQIIIEQLEKSPISNSKHQQNYKEIDINYNSKGSKFTDKIDEFWEIHLTTNYKSNNSKNVTAGEASTENLNEDSDAFLNLNKLILSNEYFITSESRKSIISKEQFALENLKRNKRNRKRKFDLNNWPEEEINKIFSFDKDSITKEAEALGILEADINKKITSNNKKVDFLPNPSKSLEKHTKSRSMERNLEENKKNEEEFIHEELKIRKIRKEKSSVKRRKIDNFLLDSKKKYKPITRIKKMTEIKAELIKKNLQKELDLHIDDEFFDFHENKLKKPVSPQNNSHCLSFDIDEEIKAFDQDEIVGIN